MKHPLIIGAGGVASYLLPVLIKAFRPQALTIVDKDRLEERNLDRQMFSPEEVGSYKADALIRSLMLHEETVRMKTVPEWFSPELVLPDSIVDVDCIICVADNHQARHDALNRADELRIPCVIGGNEYFDSEAYIYYPRWKGKLGDPRVRHPELLTPDHNDSPLSCTGIVQQGTPQLAIANFSCAAKILQLLWTHERWVNEQARKLSPETFHSVISTLPFELTTSIHESTRHSHRDPGHFTSTVARLEAEQPAG